MAAGFNRIIIIGNLTRDPDYKQLPSGQPLCQLGIASNRQYRNKQTGEMIQEVCFVDVSVFGAQAESCKNYLQKGRPVLVEGRLKFDSWPSPDGQKRTKHSIIADRVVFLGTNNETSTEMEDREMITAPTNQSHKQEESEEMLAEVSPAQKANKSTKRQKNNELSLDDETDNSVRNDLAADVDPDTNQLAFEDEPPFKDDLPF